MDKDFIHIPVLSKEVLNFLNLQEGQNVADLTLGLGGHSEMFCKQVGKYGLVIGVDQDREAISRSQDKLSKYPQFQAIHGNFANLSKIASNHSLPKFNAILADLGISSMQLEDKKRGFSFLSDATLDMRMNPDQKETAKDIINKSSYSELKNILYKYGEERQASKIAQAIIKARPINTTKQLAELVSKVKTSRFKKNIHPATQTFQAIRMAVNDELTALKLMLPQAFELLEKNGKLIIISFHSLEDQIVKKYFRDLTAKCHCPKESPICTCNGPLAQNLVSKIIQPSDKEIISNCRSRSAKMRAVYKLPS
ncbi:MAG: 16S rRNA (cytosine(1402)-N(4))-methyltransferase RsmH [Patescibacteria group bacterium]|nr:16S rRNA (cytosine(1402)-N(4))-methyltransferase RsmH [Patescibacteria group bacterium]